MKIGELWGKFELYIMSLWLLFFLIIVVTIDVPICFGEGCRFIGLNEFLFRNIVPLISFSFILLGVLFYYRFDYRIAGSKKLPSKITKIEDMNYEHLTFLTTYIIPLICFNLESSRYLLALAILLVVIGVIYVKTDKFYANPTLAVLGFRLYRVDMETKDGEKENIVLISKERLSILDQVKNIKLDERVYFSKGVK